MKNTGSRVSCSAEFVGTMILILFGDGCRRAGRRRAAASATTTRIAWAWGLGVTLGVYVAGAASAAPTSTRPSRRPGGVQGLPVAQGRPRTRWRRPPARSSPRIIVRWNYTEVLINVVDPGHTIKTQGIFSTLPGNGSAAGHALATRFATRSSAPRSCSS